MLPAPGRSSPATSSRAGTTPSGATRPARAGRPGATRGTRRPGSARRRRWVAGVLEVGQARRPPGRTTALEPVLLRRETHRAPLLVDGEVCRGAGIALSREAAVQRVQERRT